VILREIRTVTAIAVIIALSACAREERPAPPPQVPSRGALPRPSPGTAISEADFVSENGSIDLFVIRSSELALQRSSSARIRDFAQTMIEDHKGAGAQLSLEGRRLNLLPSATLRPSEQVMFDSLASSSRFDADYVHDQRIVHQRAITLDAAYAATGSSPTLRPVAAAALPIEQRHLRLIAYL
jgi:putative membrane protein